METTPTSQFTEKLTSLKQLTNIHNVLTTGLFNCKDFKNVADGAIFIAALHKELAEDLMTHPEAETHPETAELFANNKAKKEAAAVAAKETKDGVSEEK